MCNWSLQYTTFMQLYAVHKELFTVFHWEVFLVQHVLWLREKDEMTPWLPQPSKRKGWGSTASGARSGNSYVGALVTCQWMLHQLTTTQQNSGEFWCLIRTRKKPRIVMASGETLLAPSQPPPLNGSNGNRSVYLLRNFLDIVTYRVQCYIPQALDMV